MKKSLMLLLPAIMIAATASSGQTSYGVKGSLNFFNLTMKDINGNKISTSMIPAFDAGVFAEFPLADEFVIRPELLYAGKGAKIKQDDSRIHLQYIELPVLFLYKGALYKNKILLGIGPYLALGIGGNEKSGNMTYDIRFKNNITSGGPGMVRYLKPLDFGAQMMAGVEFSSRLSLALNASLGTSDIESKVSGVNQNSSIKNVGFGLTLGYRFN